MILCGVCQELSFPQGAYPTEVPTGTYVGMRNRRPYGLLDLYIYLVFTLTQGEWIILASISPSNLDIRF